MSSAGRSASRLLALRLTVSRIGNVDLVHGSGGITQFADTNGNVQVNLLAAERLPAGELQQISVSDKGRVVGSYSNGRTLDLAEITLANFNGANYLKRIDGGAFEVTDESGPPLYGALGQDHRAVARRLQRRHRRRVHQADRDPAGLFGQYAGHHHRQPDGSGPPEHAALIVGGARKDVTDHGVSPKRSQRR